MTDGEFWWESNEIEMIGRGLHGDDDDDDDGGFRVVESWSARALRRWTRGGGGGGEGALVATRHAAVLLQDAVLSLHEWEQTDAFHFPWCLYLGTLMCWAFHGGGGEGGVGRNGRVTTDLASLIVAMTTCGSVDELAAIEGKYDTRGLARTMAQQLATVRWAVVHDAMKVLVQLADDA